jgi:hypothetical protein
MRRTFLLVVLAIPIAAELTYQKPPQEILDILNAPVPPVLGVNPPRTHATLCCGWPGCASILARTACISRPTASRSRWSGFPMAQRFRRHYRECGAEESRVPKIARSPEVASMPVLRIRYRSGRMIGVAMSSTCSVSPSAGPCQMEPPYVQT